jgi:DnaJ-class molecular chaperone
MRERARRDATAGPRGAGARSHTTRGRAGAGSRRRSPEPSGPSRREAYRILDLDPGADEGRVKRAYREKVKVTHPDRGGDETEFKRVKNAYERLVD